jgi:hypothetical protein
MDVLQFISSLAWPAVFGGGLVLFRKEIRHVLSGLRFKSAKGFGIDLAFETSLTRAEDLALPDASQKPLQAPGPASPPLLTGPAASTETHDEVRISAEVVRPELVILDEWRRIEAALRAAYKERTGLNLENQRDFRVLQTAKRCGLDDDELEALKEVRSLRNRVAHEKELVVSPMEAARYKEVAGRLLERISAGPRPNPGGSAP